MVDIGDSGFTPTLGLPDFNLMQGPAVKDDSAFKGIIEKGLFAAFSKDILENAVSAASAELKQAFGLLQFSMDTLSSMAPDKPVLPVGGVEGSKKTVQAEVPNITDVTSAEGPTGGLPLSGWFNTSMITALTVNMLEFSSKLMEMEMAELQQTLKAIMMTIALAEACAEDIRRAGEDQAKMYELQAFQGIVQAVTGAIQIGIAVGSVYGTMKSKWNAEGGFMDYKNTGKPFFISEIGMAGAGSALSAIGNGTAQAVAGFISANLVMDKARWDAARELEDTLKDLFQMNMESSAKARDDLRDMIKKTLAQLEQITTESRRAAGKLRL